MSGLGDTITLFLWGGIALYFCFVLAAVMGRTLLRVPRRWWQGMGLLVAHGLFQGLATASFFAFCYRFDESLLHTIRFAFLAANLLGIVGGLSLFRGWLRFLRQVGNFRRVVSVKREAP